MMTARRAKDFRNDLERIAEYEPFVMPGKRVSWKRVASSLQKIAREALRQSPAPAAARSGPIPSSEE